MTRAFSFTVIAVSLFLFSFNPSYADDYLEGVEAFEQGDHALALSFWLPLAEAGDGRAQYSLGKLYETADQGGNPQYKEAIKWYGKAADQGGAAAQNNLGRLFARGLGVEENQEKAVTYWQQAAQSKHAMAQYNLGLAYFRGEGTEQNIEQAVFWFHQSANNGVDGAQYALGEVYRLGLSVPKDNFEARKWYQKSAKAGNKRAVAKAAEIEIAISEIKEQPKTQILDADLSGLNVPVSPEVLSETSASVVSVPVTDGEAKSPDFNPAPEKIDSESVIKFSDVSKPVKNPRGYAGIGSLFVPKPKFNPRR
ncbi:tetratricopeptide repeat protein [Kiloniella antarctica]|uniref:Tetratricopeptide repeat protein n=1 Tax=Kiloniella antarctica TaxID=1550907 RepID=A0ABW5BR45_9PROT